MLLWNYYKLVTSSMRERERNKNDKGFLNFGFGNDWLNLFTYKWLMSLKK